MLERSTLFLGAIGIWLWPITARQVDAQQPTSITERVIGPDSTPLLGAKVELLSIGEQRTDSTGTVRFAGLPIATFVLRTSMIGYRPALKLVTTLNGEALTVTVSLLRTVQQLDSVLVRADSSSTPLSDPSGFDQRRRTGGGHYIVAQDIERTHNTETEQLFHGIPAVQMDTGGIVVIKRGEISLRDIYMPNGDQFHHCIGAQVIINGVMMPQPFNINQIPIGSIRGIEIYIGPATTPMVLRSPKTVCGTVAVWTK